MWKISVLAWKGLIRRKSRFFPSVLGFVLASAVFVTVRAVGVQSRRSVADVLTHTGTHFIAFRPACCVPFFEGKNREGYFANGSPTRPFTLELIRKIADLPSVAEAAPFLMVRVQDPGGGLTIGGFNPGPSAALANTCGSSGDVVDGRFLAPGDSGVVLAEQSFAAGRGLAAGGEVKICGSTFRVAGILNAGIRPAKADLYLTFRDAEKIVSGLAGAPVRGLANIVLVESAGAHSHARAMRDVQAALGDSTILSSYGCYKPADQSMNLHGAALRWLSWIVFAFAVLLAVETQTASVGERRRDMGILSSSGWSGRHVVSLILQESLMQSVLGASAGALLGRILAPIFAGAVAGRGSAGTASVPAGAVAAAAGLTLAGGLIAGAISAWRAVRRSPIDNLNVL
jgi:putative ABC transport system permease protein